MPDRYWYIVFKNNSTPEWYGDEKIFKLPVHVIVSTGVLVFITYFRSITMFCGTDNILQNISSHSDWMWRIFLKELVSSTNTAMDMNNVMFQIQL